MTDRPTSAAALAAAAPPLLYVLAGPNGAGKSSVAGATFRRRGADYFNPDEAAAAIRQVRPDLSQTQANSAAWQQGKRLLEEALARRQTYAFETTLGGASIRRLIERAADAGYEVRIWFAALGSAEQHIERVRQRVAHGGHDIAEADIRRRYDSSRLNLIDLLPRLAELRVYDNSAERSPQAGLAPQPRLLLHCRGPHIVAPADLAGTPLWAKPIVAAALERTAQPATLAAVAAAAAAAAAAADAAADATGRGQGAPDLG